MKSAKRRVPSAVSNELEARIQAGIARDPDNPELTDTQLAAMRPASEVLPPALYAALTGARRGRPKAEETKIPVKLRLDRSAVAAFKATGAGWQTRMNDTLVNAAKTLSTNGSSKRHKQIAAGPSTGKATSIGKPPRGL